MIYKNHPDLAKINRVTSKEDLQMVKDILYTWDAPHNDFLKTPTALTHKQEQDVLRMLKRFKKYKKSRKSYVQAVEIFMKKRKGITDLERAYILFASGVKPSELSTNFTKYTGFWDTVKGHAQYKTRMYNIIDKWEKTKNKYSF